MAFSTLSVEIYSMARAGISLTINAISGLVFVVTVLIVIGYYFVNKRSKARTEAGQMKELVQATIAIIVVCVLLFLCSMIT